MAITAFKTFIAGEVLLASDLNSSLTTIIDEVNVHGGEIDTLNGSTQGRSRNLIINGDMSVWQRGTSHTAAGYTADRWNLQLSGATTTVDRQTHTVGQTDVPGNPKYFMRVDTTTSADFNRIENRIEGVTTASGQEMTISFYAKGTNPGGGNFRLGIFQNFGTGGSPSTGVTTDITTTLAVTSSWVRYEYTFTVPSVSGKTLGTDGNDYVRIQIGTSDDASTDAWTLDLSNVQLEFGDTATDFEYVNPADQLARCKRYFERIHVFANQEFACGLSTSTNTTIVPIHYSEKRSEPSDLMFSDAATTWGLRYGAGIGIQSTAIVEATTRGTKSTDITVTTAASLTAGAIGVLRAMPSDAYIDIDAEL